MTGLHKQLPTLAGEDARNDPVEPESFRVVSMEKPALDVLKELPACALTFGG
jgi:hypothetical protein